MRFTPAFLLLLAGCGSSGGTSDVCTPPCASGFHCAQQACVADGSGSDGGVDASVAACNPPCGGLLPYCNDQHHCVACTSDSQCPVGAYCNAGACTLGCATVDHCGGGANQCCNMQCSDSTSDPRNCGGCGMACAPAHAAASCSGSKCATGACDPGWGDCDGDPKDGCEANLHVDPANCTACGAGCALSHAVDGCSDGCYIAACDFGWDDCNQDPMDGCETSVLNDPNNCGGCGDACVVPNAMASCVVGNCVINKCSIGFSDCDGKPDNGCESSTATDPKNCGKCGNVCPMNLPGCSNGMCGVSTVVDTHNLKGHTEYPLDPEKCMCCGNGVTTQATANAVCKLAGYTTAQSWVSAMVVGTNCYCWDCTVKMAWADNCCGGMAARPEITSVTCQ